MTRTSKEASPVLIDETPAPPSKEPVSRRVSRPPANSSRPSPTPALKESLERALREVTSVQSARFPIPGLNPLDPERMKAYSRLSSRLTELEVLLPGVTHEQDVAALESVLQRIQRNMPRELAWDLAEQLQITLLRISPAARLSSLLEAERTLVRDASARADSSLPYGSSIIWSQKFPSEELERLCAEFKGGSPAKEVREVSVARLGMLYEARIDAWRRERAQASLRTNYLHAVAACLIALLGALAVLVASLVGVGAGQEPVWMLLTAALTGALGAVVTGVFKLRDEMLGLAKLRSFSPVLLALPAVGATAATVLFVVLHSGLITLGGVSAADFHWAHHALIGFFAGFCEALFFGSVRKLTLEAGDPARVAAPPRPAATARQAEAR